VGTPGGLSTAGEPRAAASAAAVQDAIHEAALTRTPLRIVGRGTWLDAGHPVAADLRPLRLAELRGIIEYTPGDLTLTALAGTTLGEIAAATAAEGQWLALDPFAAPDHGGTIGATFATASAGPLAHALGLPRDLALGVEMVTGDGALVRAGGRVVKNVAGFDLTRLMTGAWGTLGAITEVTVRLCARPEVDETLVILPRNAAADAAADVAPALGAAAVAPLAAEVLNPRLAARLGLATEDRAAVLVRLGGNAERVASERSALAALGDIVPAPAEVWTALRRCEPPEWGGAAVMRWSQLPSRVGETWRHVVGICRPFAAALVHASVQRGVVRAIIPHADAAALADALRSEHGAGPPFTGIRIAERLPAQLWAIEAPATVVDRLSRAVRRAFDPHHVLNPGLLGEAAAHD
jgi:glycolate dehydrogenase FAD-binding subunit